jgi:hypothetical protein
MNTALSGPSVARLGSALLWAFNVCALGGTGCGKVSEAAPGSSAAALAAAPPPSASSTPLVGVPMVEHANYSARIAPLGVCRKDQPCAVEITVAAKGDYHINDKYPYRFKLDEPPVAVRYPKPVVGKEDATVEERKVTLKVPFVAESAGDKKISGTLSLSVCSAANCLMDKQSLEVAVKVE